MGCSAMARSEKQFSSATSVYLFYPSSKYFLQCLCLTACKVNASESRYFQLPSAFFALFQYLKSYGKQGRMLAFQRQCISSEMQGHKTFREEVGRTPEHSGSNSTLQIATASHKAYFPKALDHEDSFNLSFAHPHLRRSSAEQTHQKPGICAACLLSERHKRK